MPSLAIATCQFPTTADIERNWGAVRRIIEVAAQQGADVVHFPEAALSGYAGCHFKTWQGFDWERLGQCIEQVIALAKQHAVWVLLGSAHRLSEGHLPHNSIYVISPAGEIVDRCDKAFCTPEDLCFYTPNNHLAVFEINDVPCGVLICHDVRYGEIYRALYRQGVRCLFHSFHNADFEGPTIHTQIMPPTIQARSADNHFWTSAANGCGQYQSWPSLFVLPNGRIAGSLRRHRPGMMINRVDTDQPIEDRCYFRDRAMAGILHSGELVDDLRSQSRGAL